MSRMSERNKAFQSRWRQTGDWGPGGSSLLASSQSARPHRGSALHCICGQMLWHLDPGVSKQPSACAGALSRWVCAARSPQWSRFLATMEADSIIHYPWPADKSGSRRDLPLNCTFRKRWWSTCDGSVVPGRRGNEMIQTETDTYTLVRDIMSWMRNKVQQIKCIQDIVCK